jgi:hypothetical protein
MRRRVVVCVRACVRACACRCVRVGVCACRGVCVQVSLYVRECACACLCLCMNGCARVWVCRRGCVCVCVCVCVYVCVCVCVCVCVLCAKSRASVRTSLNERWPVEFHRSAASSGSASSAPPVKWPGRAECAASGPCIGVCACGCGCVRAYFVHGCGCVSVRLCVCACLCVCVCVCVCLCVSLRVRACVRACVCAWRNGGFAGQVTTKRAGTLHLPPGSCRQSPALSVRCLHQSHCTQFTSRDSLRASQPRWTKPWVAEPSPGCSTRVL